jgi:hypothetical protein
VLAGRGQLLSDGARLDLAPGDTVFVYGQASLSGEGLELLVVDPAA